MPGLLRDSGDLVADGRTSSARAEFLWLRDTIEAKTCAACRGQLRIDFGGRAR